MKVDDKMTLHTKKQFAELVGIKTGDLSNYIKRADMGSTICVVADGDFIDDEHPKNRLFLENRKIKTKQPPRSPETTVMFQEAEDHIKLKNEKLQEEINLLKAKQEKMNELVIPRENAEYLIKNYAKGIEDVWFTATERFLQKKAAELGLTREDVIEHKKYIREICNDAVRDGADTAIRNIKNTARLFAGKKGVGESD